MGRAVALKKLAAKVTCISGWRNSVSWLSQPLGSRELQQHTDAQPKSAAENVNRRVFVRNIGETASTAPILLGLMHFFMREVPGRVGFFDPVATPPYVDSLPRHVHLMKHACKLPGDAQKMSAISEEDAFQMLASGRHADFLDHVYAKFNAYQASHDMVVIGGWKAGGYALNAQLAAHLDAPALLVVDYHPGEDADSIYDRTMAEVQEYLSLRAAVMGIIVNKVPKPLLADMHQQMLTKLQGQSVPLLGTLPFADALAEIRLDQIYQHCNGTLLFSTLEQVHLDSPVRDILVATPQTGNLLNQMQTMNRPLVITTPDRIDTVLTCVATHMSGSIPLAGVMIASYGGTPSPYRHHIDNIFQNLERQANQSSSHTYRLPIFTSNQSVFAAVQAIGSIDPAILASSPAKIEVAKHLFDEYVDTSIVAATLASFKERLTPAKFLFSLREKCKDSPQRIILPESSDHRVLSAACVAVQKGLAHITLLGNVETVLKEAAKLGLDMTGVDILDPSDPALIEELAEDLCEARKSKGLSKEAALNMLTRDVNYVGTMLVRAGRMDGLGTCLRMVASCTRAGVHNKFAAVAASKEGTWHRLSKAHRLDFNGGDLSAHAAAAQVLKDPDMPLISSVFMMCLPDKVLVYGDCAVNVEPTPEQLALIAIASAETAAAFGIEPRIAMLSYSTQGSGTGPQVEKVVEATKIAQAKRPDLKIAGPMQYDAATNERVAAVKVKNDATGVAGRANVLIFPDLNTGNNTYKAVQQASGAIAMGPIIQGLSRPVNDLSRGCTVPDILDTICATSLQSMFIKAKAAGQA